MLVDQDRVSIRIDQHQTGGTGGRFISFAHEFDPLRFQFPLQLADIGKRVEFLRVLVPAGVEREDVLVEHALEQADDMRAVLENQPVLSCIAMKRFEAKFLIETPGGFKILNRQTDGKSAEVHIDFLIEFRIGAQGEPSRGCFAECYRTVAGVFSR